jgi:hypothetical protein
VQQVMPARSAAQYCDDNLHHPFSERARSVAGFRNASATLRLLVAGIAVALVMLVVAGRLERHALAPHPRAVSPPAAVTTATVVRPSPVVARLHLGPPLASDQDTFQLAVGQGGVWVLLHGSLVHVDPHSRVVARIRIGRPQDVVGLLVIGAGAVWVQTQGGTVRVDPRSNRVVGAAPAEPTIQIQAAGPDGLWSWRCATEFGGPCRLLRLDPRTLKVTARISLPAVPTAVVVRAGSAWVLGESGPWVWRVEVASGRTARVRLPGAQPLASKFGGGWITLGAGAVWVASDWVETPTALGSRVGPGLVRIDPATMRVAAVVPLGNLDSTAGLAVGTGGVWVQGRQPQRPSAATIAVDRVDPATARLVGTFDTQSTAEGLLAAGFGSVWLAQPVTGDLLRIDPERV